MTPETVQIIYDPHVINAIMCICLALVAALVAFVLDLPDVRKR